MPISTFERYERKFIVTKDQFERLLPAVSEYMDPDPYCLDGKSYRLVNIYFDDDQDSIIRQSVRKPVYKEKLRLRSYDVPESEDTVVYLELKCKYHGIVTKRRAGFPYKDIKNYLETGVHPATESYIYEQVLCEIDSFLKRSPCCPKMLLSYDRHAFFLKNDKETRLTFDENIITRRSDLDLLHGVYGERLIPEDRMIMEIKIPDAVPLWLSKILSEEQIFMSSFSKYGREFERYYRETHPSMIAAEQFEGRY